MKESRIFAKAELPDCFWRHWHLSAGQRRKMLRFMLTGTEMSLNRFLRYRRLLMQGREKQQQGDRQERREPEQPVCRGKQAGLKPVSGR